MFLSITVFNGMCQFSDKCINTVTFVRHLNSSSPSFARQKILSHPLVLFTRVEFKIADSCGVWDKLCKLLLLDD